MIKYTIVCPNCGKAKTLEKKFPGGRERRFCTRGCANSHNAKILWAKPNAKQLASERTKKYWQSHPEQRIVTSMRTKKLWEDNYDELVKLIRLSHQTSAFRQYASERALKQWQDEEYRQRRSKETKDLWENPDYMEKQMEIRQSPEYKQKFREITKRNWLDPVIRKKRIVGIQRAKQDPEYRKACSKRMKEMLDDPRARKEFFANLHVTPTQPELTLAVLLKENGYDGYEYAGDRSLWLGRRNPDFVWHEGRKIIEMFGVYWHDESEIEPRIKHFAEHGFQTLIIWDYELKDTEQLLAKLKNFHQD